MGSQQRDARPATPARQEICRTMRCFTASVFLVSSILMSSVGGKQNRADSKIHYLSSYNPNLVSSYSRSNPSEFQQSKHKRKVILILILSIMANHTLIQRNLR